MLVWIALILWLASALRTIAPRQPQARTAAAPFIDTAIPDLATALSASARSTRRGPKSRVRSAARPWPTAPPALSPNLRRLGPNCLAEAI